VYDNKNKEAYLFEIRICFNKSLGLIDCDGVVGNYRESAGEGLVIDYVNGQLITNCDLDKPVFYPSLIPQVHYAEEKKTSMRFPLVQIYKLLQFLKWLTL
jgi:ribonuclease T2